MSEPIKIIYVAGPYRAKTPERVRMHISQAKATAVLLAEKGWYPVTPHLNTAEFEQLAPWLTDQFYLDGTAELMSRCDAVCLVPGYEFSEGTAEEIDIARKLGIPVYKSEIDVPPPGQNVPAIPHETVPKAATPAELEDERE